jgi:hypothetical protein
VINFGCEIGDTNKKGQESLDARRKQSLGTNLWNPSSIEIALLSLNVEARAAL